MYVWSLLGSAHRVVQSPVTWLAQHAAEDHHSNHAARLSGHTQNISYLYSGFRHEVEHWCVFHKQAACLWVKETSAPLHGDTASVRFETEMSGDGMRDSRSDHMTNQSDRTEDFGTGLASCPTLLGCLLFLTQNPNSQGSDPHAMLRTDGLEPCQASCPGVVLTWWGP